MKVTRAYLMGLSKEFEKRKDYPATARRLKQEGTVRVQFTVAKDGAISGAVVAKPCPYSSLNESALAAVQAVSKFDPIPAILEKTHGKWRYQSSITCINTIVIASIAKQSQSKIWQEIATVNK